MAAAEQCSKFKFVSLQRTNFESSYKRGFSTLAKIQRYRDFAIKPEHRELLSGTKSSIENSESISAKKSLNQFKLKAYSILN